ncbi:hypothetical protein amyaer_p04695 (plasmid) [Microcystis aeruginosa NIES-2481]|nr:hypothetical protein amyaer_p04695 [Microcystis aeruginosa NIES-2481]
MRRRRTGQGKKPQRSPAGSLRLARPPTSRPQRSPGPQRRAKAASNQRGPTHRQAPRNRHPCQPFPFRFVLHSRAVGGVAGWVAGANEEVRGAYFTEKLGN